MLFRSEFMINEESLYKTREASDCKALSVNCIASAEWPCFYHGVLDLEALGVQLVPLSQNGVTDIGVFRFPPDIGVVLRAFLFCGYAATSPRECSPTGEHHKVNLVTGKYCCQGHNTYV